MKRMRNVRNGSDFSTVAGIAAQVYCPVPLGTLNPLSTYTTCNGVTVRERNGRIIRSVATMSLVLVVERHERSVAQ
jgi:hypothetical protein